MSLDIDDVFDSKEIECDKTFSRVDIQSFIAMDTIGQALNKLYPGRYASQLIEFYKAAPWALSFLSGYQLKTHLERSKDELTVKKALKTSSNGWLSRKNIQNYRLNISESAPNAKIRALMDLFFDDKGEEMLWVPPTMPYYPFTGSFKRMTNFSKSLLFSSWALVPKALSGIISYEAERRIFSKHTKRDYFAFSKKHNPSLRFEGKVSLDIWGIVYPSKTLIEMPLEISDQSAEKLIKIRTEQFEKQLLSLSNVDDEVPESRYWYALAPMLLDVINGHKDYLFNWLQNELIKARKENQSGRYVHLQKLKNEIEKLLDYNYIPTQLSQHLAELSIAGPGVCFARMNKIFWSEDKMNFILISDMVFAIITMFNKAESEAILVKKYGADIKPWKKVLNYCIEGNFQAMIDEYAHLLSSSGFTLAQASERFKEVLGFRPSNVTCQFEEDKAFNSNKLKDSTLRCHYAVPLGTQKIGTEEGSQRMSNVRDAFNSPFRPFVLNSTSIGQEGLDFHWYCSRVIHWNLPSNPIDIEQREGRVNRYKSLVVRRRVQEAYSSEINDLNQDVWNKLFMYADNDTRDNRESDLVPYWHFPSGTAKIERIVPMMPMSKEVGRLKEGLKILALYRLAFGQPRQEELISNLLERNLNVEEIEIMNRQLVINLAPISHRKKMLNILDSEVNK